MSDEFTHSSGRTRTLAAGVGDGGGGDNVCATVIAPAAVITRGVGSCGSGNGRSGSGTGRSTKKLAGVVVVAAACAMPLRCVSGVHVAGPNGRKEGTFRASPALI